MSVIDKVKDIFDGRPEVHHDEEGYWVDAGGVKHHADSLDALEGELRRVLSERQATTAPRDFDVARIHTEMVATSDIAAGQAEARGVGELEGALAAVQEVRAGDREVVEG
jgi:hypothetical protein